MSIQKIIIILLVGLFGFTTGSSKKVYEMVMVYERYMTGLEKKSVTLNFGEIVYLENDVKSDTTFVFVHGFGGNKDTWVRTIAEWDDRYHVIVLDMPGHGESVSKKTLSYTITDQAKRLHAFLEAKNLKDFYMFGHSMGGAIALRYAGSHEENLKALVLIDPMGLEKTKSDGVKLVERSAKNPLYDVCTEERLKTLLNYSMYKPPYIPDMIKDALLQEKCERRDLEKVLYDDMYKDVCCLNDIARNLHIPTLILWGEKDRMTHIDNATLFHDTIQGSELIILKEIGHVPLLEDPQQTAVVVDKFINQIEK
ncbi:MAG: alpha/beta hydrolase [Sulfurovum sp.]|nr:alpha/beta hydrolase [Sulfurovum sp.]MBT8348330.1 alpha/beta hydrolase [Sulfurovum sp.]NNJ44893.1 alpha/beta hydrolase [Sulfurovum sp.]